MVGRDAGPWPPGTRNAGAPEEAAVPLRWGRPTVCLHAAVRGSLRGARFELSSRRKPSPESVFCGGSPLDSAHLC